MAPEFVDEDDSADGMGVDEGVGDGVGVELDMEDWAASDSLPAIQRTRSLLALCFSRFYCEALLMTVAARHTPCNRRDRRTQVSVRQCIRTTDTFGRCPVIDQSALYEPVRGILAAEVLVVPIQVPGDVVRAVRILLNEWRAVGRSRAAGVVT